MAVISNRLRMSASLPRTALAYVLSLVLVVAASLAVLAGGWVDGAGGVIIVSAVGITEAALLARSSIPRIAMLGLAIPLAVAVIVPLTLGQYVDDGIPTIGHAIARYTGAAAVGILSSETWTFTVGLATLLWLCSFWTGWWALRECHGVVAGLPLVVVLGVNALNAPSVGPILVPEAAALLALVLLAGVSELGSLDASWRGRGVTMLPNLGRRYTVAVAAGSIVVLSAALLLPPLTSVDVSGHFFPGPNAGNGGGGDAGTGSGAGDSTPKVGFNSATEPGGPLRLDPQVVLRYTTDIAVPSYLRVVNDTVFEAGNWYPDGWSGAQAETRAVPPGPLPRDRNPGDGGVSAFSQPVALHITSIVGAPTGGSNYAVFPGEPDQLGHGGTVIGSTNRGGAFLAVDAVSLNAAPNQVATLEAVGTIPTATADQLRSASDAYPDFVQPSRNIEDDGSGGLESLRHVAQQWTTGTHDAYSAASAIEQHLRDPTAFRYTLSPPVTPKGVWPIVYFLNRSHAGYCQYFAASMGALLRSIGIPARVVNGYGSGSAEEQSGPGRSTLGHAVSTTDAHTWVEAYFPGYGWVPFEPTPPSALGNYQPVPRGRAVTNPSPAPSGAATPKAQPTVTVTPSPSPSPSAGGGGPSGGGIPRWLTAVGFGILALLVFGAAGALAVVWWRRPRSLAGAWRRLALAGRFHGVRRSPAETRAMYASRLGRTVGVESQLATVAALSGKAEFGPVALDHDDVTVWRSLWREIAGPLLRGRT